MPSGTALPADMGAPSERALAGEAPAPGAALPGGVPSTPLFGGMPSGATDDGAGAGAPGAGQSPGGGPGLAAPPGGGSQPRRAAVDAPAADAAGSAPPARPATRNGGAVRDRQGRPRRDDPQPLRAAISGLLGDQGWQTAAAVGSVFGRWDQIVGPELAAHTRPDTFADGELVVVADSTAWATQVRLLAANLVRRLNEEIGNGSVRRVAVRGPAPPRRSGPWRVRNGRGPRDDYG